MVDNIGDDAVLECVESVCSLACAQALDFGLMIFARGVFGRVGDRAYRSARWVVSVVFRCGVWPVVR